MLEFFKGKRVLVTGHTGFKGSWLCIMLKLAGAEVIGYALEPTGQENLFQIADVKNGMVSITGDIRNLEKLMEVFKEHSPEIVFHLAAQPIVRTSYEKPVYTYETNVMGTVNLLECVRQCRCVRSVVNVTTDKVYENKEWEWGYRENEPLDGFDPYSNSKSCSELVTHSYKKSFLDAMDIRVSTARAGNVIGGGDFAKDRIIPDCIRAASVHKPVGIRNPYAVRPFQHVLEPLTAYLMIAMKQWNDFGKQGYYNVGPDEQDCVSTGALADLFCEAWGEGQSWLNQSENGPHEAKFLKLDCSRIKSMLGWRPVWDIKTAVQKTVQWTKAYFGGEDVLKIMKMQVEDYLKSAGVR